MIKIMRLLPAVTAITLLAVFGSAGHTQASPASVASPSPEVPYEPTINPSDFSTVIDNPFYPLIPGTAFVYEGTEGDQKTRDEVTVTNDTKEVLGVTCVAVLDRVYTEGQLTEETYDWYAQDSSGNVWYFGEASTSLEEGTPVSTEGSWEAGVDGAQPGIIMPADPQVGDTYRQEYYPGVAEDMAEVIATTGSITVPYGAFDSIIVTREWTALEPDTEEQKTYARGFGDVHEVTTKGDHEEQSLVEIKTSSPASPVATPTS